jgi:L-lactate dehydrogenase complex protein LldG
VDSRTTILSAIKRSLAGEVSESHTELDYKNEVRPIDNGALIERFTVELQRVGGEVIQIRNHTEAAEKIAHLLSSEKKSRIMIGNETILQRSGYSERIQTGSGVSVVVPFASACTIEELARFDASVIAARYLIADTGTVVLITSSLQPRALTILPETIFIVAKTSCVVPDLKTVLVQMCDEKLFNQPSSITLVTGPSRTADIEKTLVTGVHGPKRVIVLLVAD